MTSLRICLLAIAAATFAACTPAEEMAAPRPQPEDPKPDAAMPDEPEPEPAGSFAIELDADKLPILQGSSETVKVTVDSVPARAGVDPYRKHIDRTSGDNEVAVDGSS